MDHADWATNAPASGETSHGLRADTRTAQEQLLKANRALKLLSACNDVLIRGEAEPQLLSDICNLIVGRGGYLMAWVGMAEQDGARRVLPVAQAGNEAGYLDQACISWDDTEYGSGTSGAAIRTGQVQVNQEFLTNPAMRPWRDAALARGYQSCISLPLHDGGKTFGVLSIYSSEPQAFNAEEVALLEELSHNLAYGIVHLREHGRRVLMEYELRESEMRFRALFEHAPDAIVVFDVQQDRMVDANANAEALFECSREELLRRSPRDFYPPAQPDAFPVGSSFREHNERALAGEQPVFERLVRSARGRERLCEVRLVRLPASGRQLVRGSLVDITERKMQEQALRESTAANSALEASTRRLRSILDNLFAWVALLDARGFVQEVNQALLDRSGLRRDEVIGRRFTGLQPWLYDAKIGAQLAEAVEVAAQGLPRRYETAVEVDGKLVPIDFQISPIRDEHGSVTGLLATAVDVTERTKADEALRRSENKLRILFESATDCLLLLSADGRILDINQSWCARLGYTREEMLGRRISEFDSADFAPQVPDRMARIQRDGQATFESAHMRRDGSVIPVEINCRLVEMNGELIFFSIIRDITERKLAERAVTEAMQQMRKKELAKTHFLAAAGHDLRQPLTAASLYIDTLKRTGLAPRQQEIVERLTQAMGTFKSLLDALLDISKLDAGAIKPKYTAIDAPELLIWLERNFAALAKQNAVGLRLFFPLKETLAVLGDPGLLKSILMNLVSNAVKFTPKGAILLSVRRRGGHALFQVWDTGIGIPEEHLGRIFDEFYQVNNAQRDRNSGLGLGLAIAARAAALLGGKIECRSRAERGSVFGFTLPLEPHGPAPRLPRAAAAQAVADSHAAAGKRFVVVEDDALVAQAVCAALAEMGGEVRHFHDADSAMPHAEAGQADHYIVDYTLGGTLNGLEFLNRLREKVGKPINAVVVTGETSPAFVRGMADCHWPVLHKPVNISELLACLGA